MAMEVIKTPLQPASQGVGGSYGNGSMSAQMANTFTSENCNPNMDKEAVTPVKCTPKKTPVKLKTTTLGENDLRKSPVRRRLNCDDGSHDSGTLGKSPAKAALLKEAGASPHKHFCRSPRCAANNPDYAVPAPRQYLKSKRHLLAGWQTPLNSKLKTPTSAMRGENTGTDPVRASKTTDSDFSMHSIGEEGSDSRRLTCGSSRPPRRRYHRKGSRRLSIGTASNQSVRLHRQEGLKRKKAEEWMWDTAIKDAVQRLAPQVPGSVNVLVKAFESVKLTEEEIQMAKYKNTAVGQLVVKDSPFKGSYGAIEPDMSQMETIASINKVHAWDESMASAGLDDETNADKPRQDENLALTPKKSQARIPPFTSKSEPPKVQSSRWATSSDESMTVKEDTFSDKGASSISRKSRITEWTRGCKSQAGRPHKQKLKRCTSLHPFRLRTEERGAVKEYEFSKRLHQMWKEEQQLRIPLAQGLPRTTEEPAVPPKPAVKEQTKQEGFKLITDIRAVERAEFDEYIAERQRQEELQKLEEERQRQIAEEEEVRRLRREMVPRAQLMPYFDRPFMPRRSSKKLTVPREPKFHLKQSKRPRCMASCNSITA